MKIRVISFKHVGVTIKNVLRYEDSKAESLTFLIKP